MAILLKKSDNKTSIVETQLISLIDKLTKADAAYYNSGKPVMSDRTYDSLREDASLLFKKLKVDSKESTAFRKAASYFKKVGAPVRESKRSAKLPTELGSLKKVKSDDRKTLDRFIRSAQQTAIQVGLELKKSQKESAGLVNILKTGHVTIITSPKLDGLTLLLHYRNGKLINAFTRGDGTNAQSKVEHANALAALGKLPSNLPKSAFHKFVYKDLYIKGEVVCRLKTFNAKWQGKGYTNARNAASGWLNSDKADHPIHNAIDFIAYDVYTDYGELGIEHPLVPGSPSSDKLTTLTCLKKAGFRTYLKSPFFSVTSLRGTPPDSWVERLNDNLTLLNRAPYQLDGIVLEVSSNHVRAALGSKDGRPKFAVAYKTSADDLDNNEGADTVVTKIEYNTSKTGALKPTLHYSPVSVMNSTLSKATGNNVQYLIKTGLGVGAKIRVVKAGGVIPKAHLIGPKVGKDKIVPSKCECGAPAIEVKKNGKLLPDYYCSKPNKCKVIQRELLQASLKSLKIVGISGKTVDKLFEAGYCSLGQVLNTPAKKFMQIPGFGQAAAASLTKGVEQAIKKSSVAELMSMSGVFMEPGLALARESFEKLEKVLGKDLILNKTKALKAIGPAKGNLFISKYPEWVNYKKEHLSKFI